MIKDFRVGQHTLGQKHPTYFIADIAANHDGDLERAKALIHLCARAGANAAKFQNFSAKTIVSDHGFRTLGEQKSHQSAWGKSVFEVYDDASLPLEWTETLHLTCIEAGIDYFTAPYDLEMIPVLSKYVCAWKLGSGDITWHENIEAMARDGKPLFIASGAATMEEVKLAVAVAREHAENIVLMQCNTNYTGSIENMRHVGLNVLKSYAREFPDLLLGLSDHTPLHATVLGAVALGARVVEKHFTDDVKRKGPDHGFSLDSKSWLEMVERTRELEAALGDERKRVMENELETVILQRRAIRARQTLQPGDIINKKDLVCLRPCPDHALPPYRMEELIGRRVAKKIMAEECVDLEDLI